VCVFDFYQLHAVLRELREKIQESRFKRKEKRKKEARGIAEEDEMPKKKSAWERFGCLRT